MTASHYANMPSLLQIRTRTRTQEQASVRNFRGLDEDVRSVLLLAAHTAHTATAEAIHCHLPRTGARCWAARRSCGRNASLMLLFGHYSCTRVSAALPGPSTCRQPFYCRVVLSFILVTRANGCGPRRPSAPPRNRPRGMRDGWLQRPPTVQQLPTRPHDTTFTATYTTLLLPFLFFYNIKFN